MSQFIAKGKGQFFSDGPFEIKLELVAAIATRCDRYSKAFKGGYAATFNFTNVDLKTVRRAVNLGLVIESCFRSNEYEIKVKEKKTLDERIQLNNISTVTPWFWAGVISFLASFKFAKAIYEFWSLWLRRKTETA